MCLQQYSANIFSNPSGRFLEIFHCEAPSSCYLVTQILSISEFNFLLNPGETTGLCFILPTCPGVWKLLQVISQASVVSTLFPSLFSSIILLQCLCLKLANHCCIDFIEFAICLQGSALIPIVFNNSLMEVEVISSSSVSNKWFFRNKEYF